MTALNELKNRILLLNGSRRLAVAFIAGAIASLATAPFHFFVVCFFAFPVLIFLLDGCVPALNRGIVRRAMPSFLTGWAFGFGYFLFGVWWLANALLVEASDFIWFIPLAVAGLPAVLAIFYGLATALARAFWSDGLGRIFVFAAFFGLGELARSYAATGFPWNAIGYAITPTPIMMQSASLIGIDGLNYVAALLFALPAAFADRQARPVFVALLLIIPLGAIVSFGAYRLSQADNSTEGTILRIVQPSIDQSTKTGGRDLDGQFQTLLDLTDAEPADDQREPDIVLWPETAVPYLLTQAPQAVAAIADRLNDGQTLLTGAVRLATTAEDANPRYYNSITVLDDTGVITGSSNKVHLVPFGEYLPFRGLLESMGLRAIAAADRGYTAGDRREILTASGGISVYPLICYEATFPRHAVAAAGDADIIISVSNDAWYGNTPGPHQHFFQSRLRAVETGIPMVRAANSGMSGAFDAHGRNLIEPLALSLQASVDVGLPASTVETLYTSQGKYYHWLIFSLFLVSGLLMKWRENFTTA
ncbi:MAG: apolipoprotein N-acyltransferase [Pseudomonadota bacterium]